MTRSQSLSGTGRADAGSLRGHWVRRGHRVLAYAGLAGLCIWGLSGLLHPLMTTFGPQQTRYFGPQSALAISAGMPLQDILREAGVRRAAAIRVVTGAPGTLLQVTEQPDAPRRYFDLASGRELPAYDPEQAVFLARHYLGGAAASAEVAGIDFLRDFTTDYPWVNRLLPVYRIRFATEDGLTAYVYTETSALAAVSNRFKEVVQTGFRWFHTWDWLGPPLEPVRILALVFLVGSLLVLALSGLFMLVVLRRRQRPPGGRGWHRMAAYFLGLPVLMLTASGLYHLLHGAVRAPEFQLRFSSPIRLDDLDVDIRSQWQELTGNLHVNNLSLVTTADGELLYRIGLAAPRSAEPAGAQAIRSARFDGVPRTGPALYLNARTAMPWQPGDRELALQLGERFSGTSREQIDSATLVTRFGPFYDFRNKRLPVWRLDYADPVNASLYVDTTTGVLVDRLDRADRPERLSFSFLHKWNFLMPLGRGVQNLVIAGIVVASLGFLGVLGWRLKRRSSGNRISPRPARPLRQPAVPPR